MRIFFGSSAFVAGLVLGATPTVQSSIHQVFSALNIIPAAVAVAEVDPHDHGKDKGHNDHKGHGDKKAPEATASSAAGGFRRIDMTGSQTFRPSSRRGPSLAQGP